MSTAHLSRRRAERHARWMRAAAASVSGVGATRTSGGASTSAVTSARRAWPLGESASNAALLKSHVERREDAEACGAVGDAAPRPAVTPADAPSAAASATPWLLLDRSQAGSHAGEASGEPAAEGERETPGAGDAGDSAPTSRGDTAGDAAEFSFPADSKSAAGCSVGVAVATPLASSASSRSPASSPAEDIAKAADERSRDVGGHGQMPPSRVNTAQVATPAAAHAHLAARAAQTEVHARVGSGCSAFKHHNFSVSRSLRRLVLPPRIGLRITLVCRKRVCACAMLLLEQALLARRVLSTFVEASRTRQAYAVCANSARTYSRRTL